jgi:toxin ParE1/3/4
MAEWVLSPLALEEIRAILDYIAEESGSAAVADRVAGDFVKALDSVAASPGIGWLRNQLTGPGFRSWRVHSYLVVYDPASEPLRIIRVLHGARDLESLFSRES